MSKEVVYKPVDNIKTIYPGGTITPPKYTPSYYEWLRLNGQYINCYKDSSGVVYTVPEGFILYITDAYLSASFTVLSVGGYGTADLTMPGSSFGVAYLCELEVTAINQAMNQAMSYKFPIMVGEKSNINLSQSAGSTAFLFGSIQGFLVPNNLN